MIRRAIILALFGTLCVLTACGGGNGPRDGATPTAAVSAANDVAPPSAPTAAEATGGTDQAVLPRDLLGTWTCQTLSTGAGSPGNCAITLTIQANGSYRMGPGVGGKVSLTGKTLEFAGQGGIQNWGPATLVKPGRMDFQWTDKDGNKYWAVFYQDGSEKTPSTPTSQQGAQTQPSAGEVGVSPSSASAGTRLTVTTRGIPPNAPMQVCVYNSAGRAVDCPKATSTSDGSLTVTLDTTGYEPGPYTITILDSFSIPQAFHGAFTITP